jgi:pilus assembly protein CpaE
LVDASLQMGVCANLLDLKPSATLTDAIRQRDRLDESLVRRLATPHACGLHLLPAPSDAVEGADVDDETLARVLTLARRAYDHVVVDTFPMLDRVMMTVLDLSDRVFLVLESVVPTVLGAVKLVRLLDGLNYPRDRQRVLLNRQMSGLGNLSPSDVAERLGRDIDAIMPYRKGIITAANLGRPYILGASRMWGFGRAVHGVADDLEKCQKRRSRVAATVGNNGETVR